MTTIQASGPASFSLFPNSNSSTPRPSLSIQTRRSESRERRALSPQQSARRPSTSHGASPRLDDATPPFPSNSPPQDDTQPQPRSVCPLDSDTLRKDIAAILGTQSENRPPEHGQQSDARGGGSSRLRAQQPRLTIEVPRRPETAPSQIHPPPMTNPSHIRSSIAKAPMFFGPPSGQQQYPQQSIFPTYNPDLPLQQQNYAPAQMSQPQIPRAVISRQSYFELPESGPSHSNARNHFHAGAVGQAHDPPVVPKTCTTDQLRELWKVANGWKASGSEGKVFCLKLSQQRDAPIYNLSSASQAFYNLRLDPTSVSANICLSRHDPAKSLKASRTPSRNTAGIFGAGSRGSESKHWHEALCTTIEEESRRHQPNDGLVAILKPSSATRMVVERPEDPLYAAAADRECARLVWDDDSASYFLVHPALASPFRVAINQSPAWSRFEYTLEHHESPNHLAKLTRDGTGGGWLEIDTGVASKIEAFYVVDVAVAALLIIAAMEDRRSPTTTKTFDAPPLPELPRKSHSRSILLTRHQSPGEDEGKKQKKKKKEKGASEIQQFEVDIESQDGSLGKNSNKKSRDKGPFLIRVIAKLASGLLNCFVWVLTITFRCIRGICGVFCKCLVSKY